MPASQGGGGTQKTFDIAARVTFLGLKFDNLLFWGVAGIIFFWLTGNLHYFLGCLEKKLQNYFPEIDFHLLFCLFF